MKLIIKWILVVFITLGIVNVFLFARTNIESVANSYRFDTYSVGRNLIQHLGEITPGVKVTQGFTGHQNNLSEIKIFISTFNRSNKGDLILKLSDVTTKRVLREVNLDNNTLRDNEFLKVKFEPIEQTKGRLLELEIQSNKTDYNNSVTVWRDSGINNQGPLNLNEELLEGALVLDLVYENKLTLATIIWINIVFLILNITAFKLFRYLRHGSE